MTSTKRRKGRVYKSVAVLGRGKDTYILLGSRERQVLKALVSEPHRPFKLSEICRLTGLDKRRAYDVLKRLIDRGLVVKVSTGFYRVVYELLPEIRNTLSLPSRKGKVRVVSFPSTFSLFLDNVRGRTVTGRTIRGDRFGRRETGFLRFLDSVSYFEVGVLLEGIKNDSILYMYYSRRDRGLVVEIRPYSKDGRVRRGDWGTVLRQGLRENVRILLKLLRRIDPFGYLSVMHEELKAMPKGFRKALCE